MWETVSAMSFKELLSTGSIIFILLTSIIEFSPIKLNPWSYIAKKIGKVINEEMLIKMDRLEARQEKLETDMADMKSINDERDAKGARSDILCFGDELLRHPDIKHSKEQFDNVLLKITEYNHYCDAHAEFKNHIAERTIKHILEIYDECLEKHNFL